MIRITIEGEPMTGSSTIAAHIASMLRRESPMTKVEVIDEDGLDQESLASRSIYALGIDRVIVEAKRKL